MRILHTADWHLGHSLHGVDRLPEHAAFLDWLVGVVHEREVDAVLVAGDIFETANPPTAAQRLFYDWLARMATECPGVSVVVTAGNHDAPARIDAPAALAGRLGLTLIGALPRDANGRFDTDGVLVPLTGRDGSRVWCVAVPFLRPVDLPAGLATDASGEGELVRGVREVYARALAAATARRAPHEAIIAMGHCYMQGGAMSEDSERRILGGHANPIPASVFPPEIVSYAALGHLHLAQEVGRSTVRYSGSPIPLSLAEAGYTHQVVLVDVPPAPQPASVETVPIPRTLELLRIPADGPAAPEAVLLRLAMLPFAGDGPRPLLEVRIRIDGPRPELRRDVEHALAGRHARLLKLSVTRDTPTSSAPVSADLSDLRPDLVFERLWRERTGGPCPPDTLARFHELWTDVTRSTP